MRVVPSRILCKRAAFISTAGVGHFSNRASFRGGAEGIKFTGRGGGGGAEMLVDGRLDFSEITLVDLVDRLLGGIMDFKVVVECNPILNISIADRFQLNFYHLNCST